MKFDYEKPTKEMSKAELELREVYSLIHDLERKIKKMEAMAEHLASLLMISHSLLVVRKIGEDKLDALKELLD